MQAMSALPWFRLYHRMVDDEKLRLLAFEDRWHFVALCCLKASGLLDEPDSALRNRKLAVKLGIQVRELEEVARRLQEVNLIDETLNPLAWDELQYRSDNSTDRVKKFRQKQAAATVKRERNVSVTVQETDTESDTDIPAAKATGRARAPSYAKPYDISDQVWQDFEKHRRAKKAPISETVISAFRREGEKIGWTLEAALIESVARDWRGFKSEWVKENERPNQNFRAGSSSGVDRRSSLTRAIDEGLSIL